MIKDKLAAIWHRLTEPNNNIQETERRFQVRLVASMMLILLPLGLVTVFIIIVTNPSRSLATDPQLRVVLLSSILMGIAYFLSRSENYLLSVTLLLFSGFCAIYLAGYADGQAEAHFPLYYLSILILISGFLLPIRFTILSSIIILLPMPLFPLLVPAVPLRDVIIGPFVFVALSIASTLLVSHYRNQLEQRRKQQLTQLLNDRSNRTAQLTALHEISLNIISHHDINELLRAITTRGANLLEVSGSSLFLVNPDGDTMTVTAVYGPGQELQGSQVRRGEGMSGQVLVTGKPLIVSDYDQWTGHLAHIPHDVWGSIIQVPILSSEEMIGVLSCGELKGIQRTFTKADIQLLEGLANLSAIAIQNTYLFKEEQLARDRAERLQAATQALSSSLVLQDVFENILVELQKVVPYDSASVQELKGSHALNIIGGHGFSNIETLTNVKFDLTKPDNPNHKVIESRSPVILEDAPAFYSEFGRKPHNETVIHSWMGVPLVFGNQIKGMLALDKKEVGFYTQEHARLASAFAAQAAVAIENASLFEETQQHAFELETLAQISASLRTAKTVPEMMPILLQKIVESVKATFSVLFLVDHETGELVSQISSPPGFYRQGLRQSPGDGITGHVAATREIYISEDTAHDPLISLLPGEHSSFQGTQSSISVPVQTPDQLVGVMHIASHEARTFTDANVRLLTAVSNIAANALDRATVMDTLEEHVAERTQELAQANARLQELDILKTKFISDISHELRTPVATLNLYMDLLERGKPEKKLRYMEILRQKTDLLVRLTEDILNVSRLNLYEGKLKFLVVNLNDTIAIVIAMHQERAQAMDINLTFTPAPNLPPIYAERNQLMHAITNIVSNALNYTPVGSVHVSTSLDPDLRQACLQISDTGIGIESDEIPHIFERFYRGRNVAQSTISGTGLGLAIAKEIVDLHNGSIAVESSPDQGTTFQIRWPLAKKKNQEH